MAQMSAAAGMLELSVSAAVPILVLFAALATDLWVYADAKLHDERGTPVVFSVGSLVVDAPVKWFVGCLILWILVFPLYIKSRGQVGS
jgi:putative flippase GtrA